jgi:hypothetical protein
MAGCARQSNCSARQALRTRPPEHAVGGRVLRRGDLAVHDDLERNVAAVPDPRTPDVPIRLLIERPRAKAFVRQRIQIGGDAQPDLGVPRLTARGWLGAPATGVVSFDVAVRTDTELRQEIVLLRRRVQKLAALLRLVLAVQRAELFPRTFCTCPDELSSSIATPIPTVAERSVFSLPELKGMSEPADDRRHAEQDSPAATLTTDCEIWFAARGMLPSQRISMSLARPLAGGSPNQRRSS